MKISMIALLSILWFGTAAQASDLSGRYSGKGHFSDIKISSRGASEYWLETDAYYPGDSGGAVWGHVSGVLQPEGYTGAYVLSGGTIGFSLEYPNGKRIPCNYRIFMRVTPLGDQIYLTTVSPAAFPERSAGCPYVPASGYIRTVWPKPYTKK